MSIKVMKQALEALNRINRDSVSREHAQLMSEEAITALRQAIEKAEYEQPFCYHDGRDIVGKEFADHSDVFPLYTAPPQRQPLTDAEISDLWDGHTVPVFGKTGINPIVFARAIEQAHGIKEKSACDRGA